MHLRAVFSVLVALSLAAPTTARATELGHSAFGSGALVWGRDGDGNATTFRIAPGATGNFAHASGIFVASGAGVQKWAERTVAVPTGMPCETDATAATEPGTGVRATLVPIGAGKPLVVSSPDFESALQANEYSELVTLEASLGPYLFIHEVVEGYWCGAHGSTSHDFFVADARTGRSADLYGDAGREAVSRAEGPSALAALRAQQNLFTDAVTLSASWPTFAPGSVSMSHLFTGTTCYACSDGRWDSYTTSTEVTTADLPPALQPYARAAASAAAAVQRAHPEIKVGGVSFPDLGAQLPAALR